MIDKGNELKQLFQFLNVGKPLLITPTMDYHRILWVLTFTNSLLNEGKKVRCFSLYESKDNMLELIEKYHWHLRKNVLESREANGTFVVGRKDIDTIVEIINTDKPDVAIIDYFIDDDIDNVQKLKYTLAKLTGASKKNNTAIVIFGGKSKKQVSKKKELQYWVKDNNSDNNDEDDDIKEKSKEEKEELRNMIENGFHKIISIRPANMVEILEPIL